jgi:pimeloyl-ACP methyl ester carboxylesterase
VDHLEVPRLRVAAHGWGTLIARELAAANPGRIDRLLLFSPPAPTALERWLTRPVIGELLMGSSSAWLMRRWYRKGAGGAEGFVPARVQEVWQAFDQGTQRATLRLLRAGAVPPESSVPRPVAFPPVWVPERTLIIAGERDPWRGAPADATPGADIVGGPERVSYPTGHWPWLHGAAAERAVEFLTGLG